MTSAFDDPARANDLYRAIVETSPYFYCVLDADARFTFVSAACEPMLGYEPASLIGRAAFDFVHPDDVGVAAAALTQIVEEFDDRPGEGVPIAMRLVHLSGAYVDVEVGSAPMLEDPTVRGVIIRARPMSGQQFLDRALEALVASSPLDDVLEFLIASLDHELSHARAVMVYGWDGEQHRTKFAGGFPAVMVGGVGPDSSALWRDAMAAGEVTVHADLEGLPADVRAAAEEHGQAALWIAPVMVGSGEPAACIGIWRDIPGDPWVSHQVSLARAVRLTRLAFERRRAEELLVHAAMHDTLTGVANRAQFFDRLGAVPLAERRHPGGRTAVLYLDLDGFKSVNDTFGHTSGDVVLRTVTDRMLRAVRADDLVARLGGDEFAVLCQDVSGVDQATALADRLIAAVSEPIDVGEGVVRVGASIGIALSTPGVTLAADLLDAADRALYQAKDDGKGCWRMADHRA